MKVYALGLAPYGISESCFVRHAALAILPPLMHLVHTRIRRAPPCGSCTRTNCRFGLNRRGVRLFACDTLLPNCGPLPQASHFLAMMITSGSLEYGLRVRTRSGSDGIDTQLDFMIRSLPLPVLTPRWRRSRPGHRAAAAPPAPSIWPADCRQRSGRRPHSSQ